MGFRVNGDAVYMPSGPKNGLPPNTFNNIIFAYARSSMFREGNPWLSRGCQGASMRASLTNNIFLFRSRLVVGISRHPRLRLFVWLAAGISFRSSKGTSTGGPTGSLRVIPKAFHAQNREPNDPSKCTAPPNPDMAWTYLSFSQWRENGSHGTSPAMREDGGGTASVDPGFGKTGQPSDFLLTKNPMPGFNFANTNDTINHAGRSHPGAAVPDVPATFPNYRFSSF